MKLDARQAAPILALALSGAVLGGCANPAPSVSDSVDAAAHALSAFPTAIDGYQRHVIELPAEKHEDDRKLELMGGKEMTVDCNARGLDGQFETRDVKGWGYTYWVLQSRGQVLGTMMACPPGSEHVGFMSAQPKLVRYNSKLPVVVFVPEGMTLHYRVWRAGVTKNAPQR